MCACVYDDCVWMCVRVYVRVYVPRFITTLEAVGGWALLLDFHGGRRWATVPVCFDVGHAGVRGGGGGGLAATVACACYSLLERSTKLLYKISKADKNSIRIFCWDARVLIF